MEKKKKKGTTWVKIEPHIKYFPSIDNKKKRIEKEKASGAKKNIAHVFERKNLVFDIICVL